MDTHDLIGVKEPLLKLIEVISVGVGDIFNPYLIRKTADARAYEMRKIHQAIEENSGASKVKYVSGVGFEIISDHSNDCSMNSLEARALSKQQHQQIKKQDNLEQITQIAVNNILQHEQVSNDKVDEDWITQFFSMAENVTSTEMQLLWGKILAGEVVQPKSFSIRTLEVLKSISKEEAQMFTRLANFAIQCNYDVFVPVHFEFCAEHGINYSDLLILQEIGLIYLDNKDMRYHLRGKKRTFIHSNVIVMLECEDDTPENIINIIGFSSIGRQLFSLMEIDKNMDYVKKVASSLRKANVKISSGIISSEGSYDKLEMLLPNFISNEIDSNPDSNP